MRVLLRSSTPQQQFLSIWNSRKLGQTHYQNVVVEGKAEKCSRERKERVILSPRALLLGSQELIICIQLFYLRACRCRCNEGHIQTMKIYHLLTFSHQAYVNLLFWYQFFCAFSGTSMIDYWQMIFFNLFFTSVPPIISGVLDKDISAETLLSLPELYKSGQNSEVHPTCSSMICGFL